jgi:Bacterial membrane protein YfhO
LSRQVRPAWLDPRLFRVPLVLALLLALLFAELLFGRHVLFERDVHQMLYGQVSTFVRCLRAGSWPLWDPYAGFGQPLLANPAAEVLYPWTWLSLVLDPGTWYTAYVLGHLLLSGVGLHALARQLGISPPAALLAAALWVASGPLLSFVSLWHHLAGAAWMPFVLLATGRLARHPTVPSILLCSLTLAGQILAGSADMCAISGVLAAGYALAHLNWRAPTDRANRRLLGAWLSSVLLALGLAAALWLPALDLVRRSDRSNLGESLRTFWSLHPWNLLQTLLPVFPSEWPLAASARAVLYESREPFVASVYLGLAALAIVAPAFAGTARRTAIVLAATGALAALLAFGRYGFVYGWATALLPPLRVLRYPSKVSIVFPLVWALLAGIGLDTWRTRGADRRLGALAAASAGGAAAVALAAACLAAFRADTIGRLFLAPELSGVSATTLLAPAARTLTLTGSACAIVLLLALARSSWPERGPALASAAAVVAVAELVAAHRGLNPTAPRALLDAPPAVTTHLRGPAPIRIYAFDYAFRLVGKSYRRREPVLPRPDPASGFSPKLWTALARQSYLSPPAAERWGLQGSFDYDALSLYPRPLRNLTLIFRAAEETPGFRRLLQTGSVDFVIALHREGLEDLEPVAAVESRFAGPVLVFKTPSALPRTYAASGVRIADGLPALRALSAADLDPTKTILLPEGDPRAESPSFVGTSRLVEYRPDRVVLETETSEPGYAVLTDAYDPGWQARVDGQAATVLRTNVAFRSVPVAAGRHQVELVYRPASVTFGLVVTSVSGLIALFALVRSRRATGEGTSAPARSLA